MSDEVVKIEKTDEHSLTKLGEFTSAEEILKYAEILIESKLVPKAFKTPEQIVAVVAQGKELGFEPVTSINNIHNIEGRPTLSVHAIAALLKKSGVVYKIIEDFVFVKPDGTVDKTRLPDVEYIDRRTTIKFFEKPPNMDMIIDNAISFTWKEATAQELTQKKNWKRMPIIMLRNRCLAIGARFVAPDALLGMYETSEWADAKNFDVLLDDEGNIIKET